MKNVHNKISFIPMQTNLKWISNIKYFPKEIGNLFTKVEKGDFLKVA